MAYYRPSAVETWHDAADQSRMSIQEYSVSNRGLRSGLVGTPSQVQEQIGKFEEAGVDLLLLQFSPQLEEMEIFSGSVMRNGV